ncbi:MAG: ATP synthase subunit I [Spirochaetota bacterium]
MSPDAYVPMLALAGGIVAGVAFFGGLYLTTRRITTTRHPVALVLSSFFSRTAVVAVGAWLAGTGGDYVGLLAYVVGVFGVRVVLVARVRRREEAGGA